MRRLWLTLALLVCINVALALVGRRPERASSHSRPERIGLVFDLGGLGDKSFNDAAYLGIMRASRELGVSTELIEPGDGSDRESCLRILAARGFDLVIGVGFIFSDDMYAIAQEYPKVHFACVDYAKFDAQGFVEPPANLVGIKFREEQGAFLVGALAALTSRSHAIGFVGGMDIPLIHKFEAGYRAGAKAVCPACRVLVGYAGVTSDAFKNPSKGKELALAQYGAGADIIFHASGSTGLGVFEAARVTSHLAIGVDADQWNEAPGYVLTSMTKKVEVGVFDIIKDLVEDKFKGGTRILGLAQDGVDYVYNEHNRYLITPEARARVEALRQEIITGRIVVPSEVNRP